MSRILVVDDDPLTIRALGDLLQMDGYDVVALSSSAAAIRRLADETFDAVITDLEMPEAHGVEVVRAARAARAGMPVLVVTAYAGSPASQSALTMGAARVLSKPVQYEMLAGELARHLQGDKP